MPYVGSVRVESNGICNLYVEMLSAMVNDHDVREAGGSAECIVESGGKNREKGVGEPGGGNEADPDACETDGIHVVMGAKPTPRARGPKASLPDDERLSRIFGHPVPPDEARIWASIPPSRRDKMLQRVAALDRFCFGEEGLTAKQAAADGGVKLGRFYQLARLWAARRSLAHLGTYASATQPRQRFAPEVVNALQSVVARVVIDNPKAPVTRLAQLLAEASGLPPKKVPGKNTLRTFVEREQRRLRTTRQAGHEVLFDCAATSLSRMDGELHTVFLVIDEGTGLVLGHSIGDVGDSAGGYCLAAGNGWALIRDDLLSAGIWAPSLERSQLVPGSDLDAVRRLAAAAGPGAPQLTGAGDHGRYMRRHLGPKLGPIQLLHRRTAKPESSAGISNGEAMTVAEANARVGLAVAAHNDGILAEVTADGQQVPPEGLVRLLRTMAGI
jgi:hypothetical protein